MFTAPRLGDNHNSNAIMFADLSDEAQTRVLAHYGCSNPYEANLDVLPIAYNYDGGYTTQTELDDAALMQLRIA